MKNIFLYFFISSLLSLTTVGLSAQHLKPLVLDSEVRHGKFENGLSYYIRHNAGEKKRANFYIVQNMGTVLEDNNQAGLTKFLEYMAFEGTYSFPGNTILSYFESLGLRFDKDIYTQSSFDETVYAISNLPTWRSELVDTALLALHDWATDLNLDYKKIESGRKLVLEDLYAKEDASSRISRKLNQLKYPGSEYEQRSLQSDSSVIMNFSAATLRNYYKTWSRPDLQAIVVVGDIDLNEIEKKIAKIFSPIPKRTDVKKRQTFALKDNAEPIVAIVSDREVQFSSWTVDYKQDVMPSELRLSVNGYLVETINALTAMIIQDRLQELSQWPSSPFLFASARYGNLLRSKDALSFSVVAQEGNELQALEVLFAEAEKLKRFGFNRSELERAKLNLLKKFEHKYKERKSQKNESLAESCFEHFLYSKPIPGLEWEYKSLQSMLPQIDTTMLNRITAQKITDKNMIISLSAPRKSKLLLPNKEKVLEALALSKTLDLKENKEQKSNRLELKLTAKEGKLKKENINKELGITEWILGNGIRVLLKPTKNKSDEILMTASAPGGLSKIEKVEDLPAAIFATDLVLESGLGDLSKFGLGRFLKGTTLSLTPFIENYSQGMRGYSSLNDFENLLKLTYLYFTDPRADKAASNLLKTRYKSALLNKRRDPRAVFSDTINLVMSGYSPRNTVLNAASVTKIDPTKALDIYKDCFESPASFTFVFVGNINPKDKRTKELILNYLGNLKSKRKKEKYIDRGIRTPQTKTTKNFKYRMQTPSSFNAIVFSKTMPYDFQNKLLMEALKEVLALRYNAVIRQKELVFSPVQLESNLRRTPVGEAILSIRFASEPKKQDRILKVLNSELYRIISYGVSSDDIKQMKTALLKHYDENIGDNKWWLENLSHYAEDEIDFSSSYRAAVSELDNAKLKTFLKKLVMEGVQMEFVMKPAK